MGLQDAGLKLQYDWYVAVFSAGAGAAQGRRHPRCLIMVAWGLVVVLAVTMVLFSSEIYVYAFPLSVALL